MKELFNLFKENPLYLLLVFAPMLEAIWSSVTGLNIIDLLTGHHNSTFWISVLTFITFAPGSLFLLITSRWAKYKYMIYAISIEAVLQFFISAYIGYHISSIKPIDLAVLQLIIVVANSISSPFILMLNRDVLMKNQLKSGSTVDTLFFVLTSSLGLFLAPIAKFNISLKHVFYTEGVLSLITALLLIIVYIKLPRRKSLNAIQEDNKVSKMGNIQFFKIVFSKKENAIVFILPPLLYLGMTTPMAGLPVWITQNSKSITIDFTIFFALSLWARTLGGFCGGMLFQKFYPKIKIASIKTIFASIFIAPLLYVLLGISHNVFLAFFLLFVSHSFSNYAFSAVWYEIDCMGEGTYSARIHTALSVIDSLILSVGPFIIGRFGDYFLVKNIWIINSFVISLLLFIIWNYSLKILLIVKENESNVYGNDA